MADQVCSHGAAAAGAARPELASARARRPEAIRCARRFASRAIVAVGLCGVVAWSSAVAQGPTPALDAGEDGRTFAGREWTLAGGDRGSARYSTLDQITTANVTRLGGAWSRRFGAGASTRATPVVQGRLLVIPAGDTVYAFDAASGEPIWTWQFGRDGRDAGEARAGRSPMESIAGEALPNMAGVAMGDGRVYVGLRDGRVVALDQATGRTLWAEPIGETPRRKGESVAAAPMYVGGTVLVGLANGDWAMRGRAVALDAATGRKKWSFFTVPGPGEPGHDTWPKDNDSWTTGGGGVWLLATVDPDLGLAYFQTGNTVPMYGGGIRKGDNLYTAAVVALDLETGRLRWHYQVVHHDLWDADIATPLLLYDAATASGSRKALAAMRADGYLFLLDRATGKPLFPVEQRKVPQDRKLNTAATQPFPVGADSLLPGCGYWKGRVPPPFTLDCSGFAPPSLNQHTLVGLGSPIPRVRITPMAFSPKTGYIYAQGVGHVGRARRITDDPWFQDAGGPTITLPDPVGIVGAIDTRTNRIAWKKEVPASTLGTSGPLVTAGGLMFRGSGDGRFEAYDAGSGDRLWEFQTGVRSARGPSATYEVDGTQYVAVAMGAELWAFALDGTVPQQPARTVQGPPAAAGVVTEEIETATLMQVSFGGAVGRRYALDEHAFNPGRARVKAGTRVMFVNNGRIRHALAARDGSWTSGPLPPAKSYYVGFDAPGTYLYHCTEHPWAIGQVTVEP
jgi:outer membrane protein assembly factor BamB